MDNNNIVDLARDGRFDDLKRIKIANTECVYRIFREIFTRQGALDAMMYTENENFYLAGFEKNHFLSFIEYIIFNPLIENGIKPIDIFYNTLFRKVSYVIVVHNIPIIEGEENKLNPTEQDMDIADQLFQFAKHVDIPLLDYIIMNENAYADDSKTRILNRVQKSLKYALTEEMKSFIDEKMAEIQKRSYDDGVEAGMVEGITRGQIQGNHERSIEIARSMKRDGCNIEMIVKYSGLSKKEIESL